MGIGNNNTGVEYCKVLQQLDNNLAEKSVKKQAIVFIAIANYINLLLYKYTLNCDAYLFVVSFIDTV